MLRNKTRHRLSFDGKIGLIIDILLIYRIQNNISDSKQFIEDIAGCVEIPKIQTKIIEDWVQNLDRNFKQSFKISKLCKVQT